MKTRIPAIWAFPNTRIWHFENMDSEHLDMLKTRILHFQTHFEKGEIPINTPPPPPQGPRPGPAQGPGPLHPPRPPPAAPGPGPGRAWALGVSGVGYSGVFHSFQNVFENIKLWFSKCPNVQNQVSGFPKGRKMPHFLWRLYSPDLPVRNQGQRSMSGGP